MAGAAFHVELTLSPRGTRETTTEVNVHPPPGILEQLFIQFPPGHAGLTNVRVRDGKRLIVPVQLDTWLKGDGVLYSFNLNTQIAGSETPLVFEGFNVDDTFLHTIYFDAVIEVSDEGRLDQFLRSLGITNV